MSLNDLMRLFKFNQLDLEANRQGRLSAEQQARWEGASNWSGMVMQLGVPLVVAGFIAFVGIVLSFMVERLLVGAIVSLCFSAVVGGGIGLFFWQRGRNRPATSTVRVGRAEGIAHLKEVHDRSEPGLHSHQYKLEIEHHSFQLFRKEQFEALENGGRYAVHYLDNEEKYIVSIEPLA